MKLRAHRESPVYPALAVAVIVALAFALPDRYRLGAPWLALALALVIVALTVVVFSRLGVGRALTFGVIVALTTTNVYYLASLIQLIADPAIKVEGAKLFASASAIWISNIVIFALWYWEVDRGGPEGRMPGGRPEVIDLQFPAPKSNDWIPTFPDYAFLAFNTATAFSPTDVSPLTHRSKLLMALESIISLVTIAVVAARALNL